MEKYSSAFQDSKKHFLILDALRGVAAVVVVLFHVLEFYAGGDHVKQLINHGYLAVDFFFMLSGYVMAHAYDDRWNTMTLKDFFKRRIIRLHPMIIAGMTIGALCYYFSASEIFPKVSETAAVTVLLITLIGFTLLPVPVSMDIRGWQEMHPLNGPAWSLFYEYIANVLHALILRKLSKIILSAFVFLAALAVIHLTVFGGKGDVVGGWSIEPEQLKIGFTRLLFPYMAGMLLRRLVKPTANRNTFLWSSLLLVAVLSVPRVGGYDKLWLNGLYESFVIILVFPVIIYLGAIGEVKSKWSESVSVFLGNISYPIYIIHYPFIYVFYAWIYNSKISLTAGFIAGIGLLLFTTILAFAILKLYDEPIRKWLSNKYIGKKPASS